jgi:hypothetical protein
VALPLLYPDGPVPSKNSVWQRAYIADRLQADDLDGIKALADAYGPASDYVFNFLDETWPPSFVAFHWGSQYELSLQGTSNRRQVLLHLGGTLLIDDVPDTAFVNLFWERQAQDFQAQATAYIRGKPAPTAIVISGHSYGGGVAGILAILLSQQYPGVRIELVTFGCPRWGSGVGFASVPGAEVRVVNEDDVVPRVPSQGTTPADVSAIARGLSNQGKPILWRHRGQRVFVTNIGSFFAGAIGEEEPALLQYVHPFESGGAHVIAEYRRRLQLRPGVVYPPGWLNASPGPQAPSGTQQTPVPPAAPMTQPDVDRANQTYYGTITGPVTVGNQTQFQSGGLIAGTPHIRPAANIQVRNGNVATPTYAKVTLVINNGIHGHKETHILPSPVTDANRPIIENYVKDLCNARKPLLGNGQKGLNYTKRPDTPQIEYALVSDAVNPKSGFVMNLTALNYFGGPSVGSNDVSGESFDKAISVRFSGTGTNGPATARRNTTCQIIGYPDVVVDSYAMFPSYTVPGRNAFGTDLRTYLDYLAGLVVAPNAIQGMIGWGFMGADPSKNAVPVTPAMRIVSWQLAGVAPNQYWTFTMGAVTTVNDGDRVRIRGANNVFNGVWSVHTADHLTFSFKKGPVTGHTPPTGGVMYGLQSGGVSQLIFYPYNRVPPTSPADAWGSVNFRESKHNPGKQWLPYSFQRRIRRER